MAEVYESPLDGLRRRMFNFQQRIPNVVQTMNAIVISITKKLSYHVFILYSDVRCIDTHGERMGSEMRLCPGTTRWEHPENRWRVIRRSVWMFLSVRRGGQIYRDRKGANIVRIGCCGASNSGEQGRRSVEGSRWSSRDARHMLTVVTFRYCPLSGIAVSPDNRSIDRSCRSYVVSCE